MRCFVAIDLPNEVRHRMSLAVAAAKSLGVAASFPVPEQLHCTLAFLGEKSEAEVKKITESLHAVRQRRFKATAAGLGFFPSENFARVFWAGLEGKEIVELQKKIVSALGMVEEKPFAAHVTLARIKSTTNLRQLIDYARENKQAGYGEFEVTKFVLKKSTLSPQGAVHEDVAEFALV